MVTAFVFVFAAVVFAALAVTNWRRPVETRSTAAVALSVVAAAGFLVAAIAA